MLKAAFAVAAMMPALIVPAGAAATPKVVVTIKPLHSLVAGVMAGVAEPTLLIRGGASPHAYALRPSDARALAEADLVFWVGEALERFMAKPLASLGPAARAVALWDAPGLALLRARGAGAWDQDRHEGEGDPPAPDEADHDPHFWLDPTNARTVVAAAVSALSEIDSAHADLYRANGATLVVRLAELDRTLRAELAPVRDRPYVAFHDAFQYFERRYRLNGVGSVVVSPGRPAGAKRVRRVQEKIRSSGAACVFIEPQFAPGVARTLVAGTPARLATLDPVGANLAPGPDAYFQLMADLAGALRRCLAPPS